MFTKRNYHRDLTYSACVWHLVYQTESNLSRTCLAVMWMTVIIGALQHTVILTR